METYRITTEEAHQLLNQWPPLIRQCPTFWNEPTIIDKTIPVLLIAVTDLLLHFIHAEQTTP